ncbi:MAG: HlyD family secretion protein, partial [Pirellulales bacterium]|nr:HlyD family secretion protein [Pirellulales bacterium]
QDAAAAQLASLEMQRIRQKIDLLEDRVDHLDIRSPIDGLVIAGDLKKTEGAPVPTGQPLFEIAPLGHMRAELYIPDDEISHVAEGQHAAFRLDAHPKLLVEGALARIHPRAEIRDGKNVFVGEVLLDNRSDTLRPGMNGKARIVTDRHALVWNLFHKAYDRVLGGLGW